MSIRYGNISKARWNNRHGGYEKHINEVIPEKK